jgi:hypothetical protein
MMPGIWIVAEDGHRDGEGWGSARLWGILSMGKRTGPEVLASQIVRNLGELPWLPWFVLADPALAWTADGESAFEVHARAASREHVIRFEIDGHGDVIRASSPARTYDVPGGFAEAPWHYAFGDHRDFDGVRLPAAAVATFEMDEGPWEYLRIKMTSVTAV